MNLNMTGCLEPMCELAWLFTDVQLFEIVRGFCNASFWATTKNIFNITNKTRALQSPVSLRNVGT